MDLKLLNSLADSAQCVLDQMLALARQLHFDAMHPNQKSVTTENPMGTALGAISRTLENVAQALKGNEALDCALASRAITTLTNCGKNDQSPSWFWAYRLAIALEEYSTNAANLIASDNVAF